MFETQSGELLDSLHCTDNISSKKWALNLFADCQYTSKNQTSVQWCFNWIIKRINVFEMSNYFEIVCSEMILSNYSSWVIFFFTVDRHSFFIRYYFFCRFRSFKYETAFKYLKLLSHKAIRFPLKAPLGENFKADCSQLLFFLISTI